MVALSWRLMLQTIEQKMNGSRVNEGLPREGGVTTVGAFKEGKRDICSFKAIGRETFSGVFEDNSLQVGLGHVHQPHSRRANE